MIYFVRICGVPRKSVDSFIGVTENARRCAVGSPQIPQSRFGSETGLVSGGRGGNRTHNPRLRRPVLYPIELLARASIVPSNWLVINVLRSRTGH
jgi:hypothetical protein